MFLTDVPGCLRTQPSALLTCRLRFPTDGKHGSTSATTCACGAIPSLGTDATVCPELMRGQMGIFDHLPRRAFCGALPLHPTSNFGAQLRMHRPLPVAATVLNST